MSDIDAVIELLERWRDATGMDRMRIGMDATRTIAQLPPARKRALAIEVAERVAPQLVPAIQSEDGDLTTQQVGAVVDLLRRADRQQLDELVTALRTGEVVGGLDLVDDAVSVVAPADPATDALLEDIATEDEPAAPAPPGAVPTDPVTGDALPDAAGVGEVEASPAEAADPAPVGPDPVEEADPGPVDDEDHPAASVVEDEEIEVREDGTLELDEEAVRRRLEAEAAQRTERYRDSSRDVPLTPAYRAPHMDFISDTELELPDPSVTPVAPLQERMDRGADTVPRPDRRLAAPPVTAVVASITATPDGYRRRRAAMEAIRSGRMEPDDVAPVVRSLDRATDRSWIAGAALDAGLLAPGDLDGLRLPQSATARLRRRVR